MRSMFVVLSVFCVLSVGWAEEGRSVAVIPFASTDPDDHPVASAVTDVFYATFSAAQVELVEREQLQQVMQEQSISVTAVFDDEQALKLGRLVAAKFLVVGRVVKLEEERLVVARLISSETSRMLAHTTVIEEGQSVAEITGKLAKRVIKSLDERGLELIKPRAPEADPIDQLVEALLGKELPKVTLDVSEQLSAAQVVDPAVETELLYALQAAGFMVVDAAVLKRKYPTSWRDKADKLVDVIISGEALIERATQIGQLHAGRARVELKATTAGTGMVIAVARNTSSAMDATPVIAAKAAAQQATRKVLTSFLTNVVDRWHKLNQG